MNVHIVVTPAQVWFGKKGYAFELLNQLWNEQEHVAVLNSDLIELLIVLEQAQQSILLLDVED